MQERRSDQSEFNHPGETLDSHGQGAIGLTYLTLEKCPKFKKRHLNYVTTAPLLATTALLVISFAINKLRESKPNDSDEEIVEQIDDDHLADAEKALHEESKLNRTKRQISGIIKRARNAAIH